MPPAKVYETPGALRTELDGDVRTLNAVRPHLAALDDDFVALQKQGDWVRRGYFSVAENDRMEQLLFRFLASHAALWDISAAYQNMQTSFDDPMLDTKAHVVSRQAGLLLASHSAFLVAAFAGDPIAIAKMNEAFYRSEIPRDSYYRWHGTSPPSACRPAAGGSPDRRGVGQPQFEARAAGGFQRFVPRTYQAQPDPPDRGGNAHASRARHEGRERP